LHNPQQSRLTFRFGAANQSASSSSLMLGNEALWLCGAKPSRQSCGCGAGCSGLSAFAMLRPNKRSRLMTL
jgi:hypothetical protein